MPLPPTLASRLPTKEALQAVRNVIQSQAKPVKTQDLYKQVLKEPNGGSAVRSMRCVFMFIEGMAVSFIVSDT